VASRRAALGVYNFVGDVGKMVVAAAMGLGIVAIGWRSSVVLYGLIVVGVGVLTLVALASLADSAPRTRSKAAPAPDPGWGFTDPTGFALLGAIQLIDSACRTGFLTFFPFLLIAKGASVASIGFGLSLVFVGGAAGKLVCGLIAERVGILRTVILTELATGALIAAAVLAPLGWAMLLLMPVGVALNGTSSVLYGTVAEFVRDDRQSPAMASSTRWAARRGRRRRWSSAWRAISPGCRPRSCWWPHSPSRRCPSRCCSTRTSPRAEARRGKALRPSPRQRLVSVDP
jgi:predicted MFS family arabinose efflux permease